MTQGKELSTQTSKHGFQLMGFVDRDFAGCENSRRSTTWCVFTLAGGHVSEYGTRGAAGPP